MTLSIYFLLCFASLQSGQFKVLGQETPSSTFEINITADNSFALYDSLSESPIGSGNNFQQVFNFRLQYIPSRLFVEAMDDGAGERWIILASSEGLVSNTSWRCVTNENSEFKPPFGNIFINMWPNAEEVPSNFGSEILPSFSEQSVWIWAPKLTSNGKYPKKNHSPVLCLSIYNNVKLNI